MSKHNFWTIPANAMTKEEVKDGIGKLAICGYTVRKGKFTEGEYKGIQYIEYWRDDEDGTLQKA